MLRILIRHIEGHLGSLNITPLNPVYYQTVRWRRKPRWLPVAKSKMFRVPVKKKIPLEEQEELKRLFNNYRTEMKSIRAFFAEQIQDATSESALDAAEEYDEEYKKCIELNEKWNAEVKLLREETLAKEKEAEIEEILNSIEETRIKMQERQQYIENIVRLEKEKSKSYITAENIDEALDKALENPVDYNFAVDLKGNVYYGRNNKPPKVSSPPTDEVKEITAAAINT
uniref:Small ribosomal subunit protein mS26 n=1 Tax=Triatoma infestans TaxID=30076 RepID=A0A023F743_TRIIF